MLLFFSESFFYLAVRTTKYKSLVKWNLSLGMRYGWIWLLCQLCLPAYAQELEIVRFERLTAQQGLSENNVRTLLQDHQGFMWIGTQDGLNRYDGYGIRVFSFIPGDTTSLSDNYITALYEDRQGVLWVGTNSGGLNRYDRRTGKFRQFLHNPQSSNALSDATIYSILEDRQGMIWVGTKRGGLNRLDPRTGEITIFAPQPEDPNALPASEIWDLHEDATGSLWITTGGGLVRMRGSDKMAKFETFKPEGASKIAFASLTEDHEGTLWLGSWGMGLFSFDKKTRVFTSWLPSPGKPGGLSETVITGVVESAPGNYWISTYGGGLIRYQPGQGGFVSYRHDPADATSLGDDRLWTLYQDRAGAIWTGSFLGGVNILDVQNEHFVHWKPRKGQAEGLKDYKMTAIHAARSGELWVGTLQGLHHLLLSSDGVSIAEARQVPLNADAKQPDITGVWQDPKGHVWVATWGAGLFRVTPLPANKYSVKQYTTDFQKPKPNDIISPMVISITGDQRGHLWIGTFHGLSRFDPEKEVFTNYRHQKGDAHSLTDNYVFSVLQDRQGNVWVGTNKGLNRFDTLSGRFERYTKESHNLTHNSILSLFEDRTGKLWVGTGGGGLNIWMQEAKKFEAFTEREGLPNNVIQGITQDAQGIFWLTTNKGICRFDPKSRQTTNYDVHDGLQDNRFRRNSLYQDPLRGLIYAGGDNGMTVFHPTHVRSNTYVPPVWLTDILLFNSPIPIRSELYPDSPLTGTLDEVEGIRLAYDQKVITFQFVALSYRLPYKNRYAYRMEGFDADWQYTSANQRSITYTNLEPGTYTFRVKASNNDGVWNDTGVSIKVEIVPPFWRTLWFQVLAVLTLSAGVYAFFRYREYQLKQRQQELEGLVRLRTGELLEKNEELHQQQEEILAQRDLIERTNGELLRNNENLHTISQIGYQVTSSLDVLHVIKLVYQNVNSLMDAACFGIGILDQGNQKIVFEGFMEKGEELPYHTHDLEAEADLAAWCARTGKDFITGDLAADFARLFPGRRLDAIEGELPRSLIYAPLLQGSRVMGVITVQSFESDAYGERELTILKALGAYIAVALSNARAYSEVKQANQIIALKNANITDSIRYAKTIQEAVLPDQKRMEALLGTHFVVYRPKDIVSGDFYWCHRKGEVSAIAVVDCTGHGVPGAFMSMIATLLLNDIVNRSSQMPAPADMLTSLHEGLRTALRQDQDANRDGMDVCLCTLEGQSADTGSHTRIRFAGAKRPLFYATAHEVNYLRGTRKSIGGIHKVEKAFEEETLLLPAGSCLYLTTDGLGDQYNPERRKYGTTPLLQLLQFMAGLPAEKQKEILLGELARHQQDAEQLDDITFVGIVL